MGRRIQWLGVGLLACFALVLGQLVNIQVVQAPRLDASVTNPRHGTRFDNFRGEILAANNAVLAESVPVPHPNGGYRYTRQYPGGALYSGIVGYASAFYGTAGVENYYNSNLITHAQPAHTLNQLLTPPPPTTDRIRLTINPYLQTVAATALSQIASPNKDAAVVVLNPTNGAVLAMYSNPSFTPNPLANPTIKAEQAAGTAYQVKNPEGDYPIRPMATWRTLAPGSTFKVVTTTAVYNLDPSLASFMFPSAGCTPLLPQSTKMICNDASTPAKANPCGGSITVMLPASCDPGYAELGLAIGATKLYQQANLFGYNVRPPIDLTTAFVMPSYFPPPSRLAPTGTLGPPGLAYAAFGQQSVQATPLQQAMVAEAVAYGGRVMTPHVMASIYSSNGSLIERYAPTVYKQAMSAPASDQDTKLMEAVATAGTARGVFPATLKAAVKTGTAQTGLPNSTANTHDWMIGFAPATNPKVAVCVTVPYQPQTTSGARVAGPIMRQMLEAALHPPPGA